MKRLIFLSLLMGLITNGLVFAQEANNSKFNLLVSGAIGYGKVVNELQPNYDLNSNTGEILLNYNFSKILGVATGLGFTELSGNGFNSNGNFYHERTTIKIPLLITFNLSTTEKLKFIAHLGPYAQKITKDKYSFLNYTEKDAFNNWSIGAQLGLGLAYKLTDFYSIGINYTAQSDFNKIKSNSNSTFNDKQKVKYLNNFGIFCIIDF